MSLLAARAIAKFAPRRSHGALLARQRPSGWTGGAAVVLSFDVDLEEDCDALPWLVAELATVGLRATFAVVGKHVERRRDAHAELVAAGHELLSHSYSHDEPTRECPRPQLALSPGELAADLDAFDRAVASIGGRAIGHRVPHFGWQRDPRMLPLLRARNWCSSSTLQRWHPARGGAPTQVDDVWELPLSECPLHPLEALDSWHCTDAPDARHRGDPGRPFAALFDTLARAGAYGSVYLDPRAVRATPAYREVLALLARRDDLRVTTYADVIARAAA